MLSLQPNYAQQKKASIPEPKPKFQGFSEGGLEKLNAIKEDSSLSVEIVLSTVQDILSSMMDAHTTMNNDTSHLGRLSSLNILSTGQTNLIQIISNVNDVETLEGIISILDNDDRFELPEDHPVFAALAQKLSEYPYLNIHA